MKKIYALLIGVVILNGAWIWSTYKHDFQVNVDEGHLRELYQASQYINPASTTWIEDAPLYTYAGLQYIQGGDPSLVNFELQPATKYLFGISTILFGNPVFVQLGLYGILIILTFFVAQKILGKNSLSLLASLLVSLDPLIRSQSHTVYLDLSQAVCILLFLLIAPKKIPIATGITIGAVALSKSYMIGGLVFAVYVCWQGFEKKHLKNYIHAAIASSITYSIGYSMFFVAGHTVLDLVELHWRILKLYKGYVPEYPKGEIFRIIFTGEWRKWYGDFGLSKVSEWWLLWPVALVSTIWTVSTHKWKNQNDHTQLAMLFMLLYGVAISLKLVFPRYIIPLLPLLYTFGLRTIVNNKNE